MVAPIVSTSLPTPTIGLREKHKIRTRGRIRRAAMELFAEQGYSRTTVEQIAAAADVSHTTFFRYFQTKEQVVVSDDITASNASSLDDVPAGLAPFEVVRRVVTAAHARTVADPWASDAERRQLINSETALRTALRAEAQRGFDSLGEYLAQYTGREPSDLAIRVFISAVSGVLFDVANNAENPWGEHTLGQLLEALDMLEQGIPL